MSREKDTKLHETISLLLRKMARYSGDRRQNFLDNSGKIGLTLSRLLSFLLDALDELGQSQQIAHTKGGSTCSQDYLRPRRYQARPGCGQCPNMIGSLVEGDAIFPPIVAEVEKLKLLAIQGMKGMGDREDSFL